MLCLDAANGNIVWDKEVFRQAESRKMAENSHATPTPVTDGKLVYAAFNGGRIVAVDFKGNVAWNWRDNHFVSKHGLAVSPILYRDKLIMPFDGNGPADINNIGYLTAWDGAFVVALDKRTGQEKWRAKRGLSRQAHVTPMVIEVNGKPQLVSGAGDVVQGFDPESGERLWTIRSLGEGVVPSIVYGQGLVFTSSGYGSPAIRAIRPGWSRQSDRDANCLGVACQCASHAVVSLCRWLAVLHQGIWSRYMPRCQDGAHRLERALGRQVRSLAGAG